MPDFLGDDQRRVKKDDKEDETIQGLTFVEHLPRESGVTVLILTTCTSDVCAVATL